MLIQKKRANKFNIILSKYKLNDKLYTFFKIVAFKIPSKKLNVVLLKTLGLFLSFNKVFLLKKNNNVLFFNAFLRNIYVFLYFLRCSNNVWQFNLNLGFLPFFQIFLQKNRYLSNCGLSDKKKYLFYKNIFFFCFY
jgi:hypothetical protein